jgi:hypothetical protein
MPNILLQLVRQSVQVLGITPAKQVPYHSQSMIQWREPGIWISFWELQPVCIFWEAAEAAVSSCTSLCICLYVIIIHFNVIDTKKILARPWCTAGDREHRGRLPLSVKATTECKVPFATSDYVGAPQAKQRPLSPAMQQHVQRHVTLLSGRVEHCITSTDRIMVTVMVFITVAAWW